MPTDDDDLIRDRLRRAAEPADPSGAYERILERRVRRRIWNRARVVTVAVAVVVATVGGTVALASVFRSAPVGPGSAPTQIGSTPGSPGKPGPSQSASQISVEPSGSPSESPSPSPVPCSETTTVAGDFDGDGISDTVTVIPPSCPFEGQTSGPDWGVDVRFGSGAAGAWALLECGPDCAPAGVADLNGDGIDELALVVDGGASTKLMNVLEIPPAEVGPAVLTVGPDGAETEGFPPLQPALFPIGGSVTHLDFVTCRPDGGANQVIATKATLSQDQTVWTLTEVVFDVAIDEQAMQSGEPPTIQAFTVASVNTSTAPYDPNAPPSVQGTPCFPGG